MGSLIRWVWGPAAVAAACFLAESGAAVYVDGPPAGVTGGFGEDTCRMCHYDYDLNDAAGRLRLEGVPDAFAPGELYVLTIRLEHPDMERGGFQLAVRFADGERAGVQAGALEALDAGVAVETDRDRAIQYAGHTRAGAAPEAPGAAAWSVRWRAPEEAGAVVFHAAANASNFDDSPFGDYPYATSATAGVE